MFLVASMPAPAQRKTLPGLLSVAGLTLLTSTGLLLTGCGMGKLDTSVPSDPVPGTAISGVAYGGNQPVVGASVTLYGAGSTGYGQGAVVVAHTTTVGGGSFSFTGAYTCPAAPNDQLYIVVTGGNPGAGTNSNLAMMVGLGTCATVQAANPNLFINEVTTVASAYALQQFMSVNGSGGVTVGASSGNYQGLANAMATVSNMVNLATGQAYTITPAYATNTVAYLNSSTVPQSRINTLANILAACVNSTGLPSSNPNSSACGMLFTAATPSGGTAPTDTLQAILDIAQYPLPAAAPIALSTATSPFQPSLATAPADWTLALTFTGGGLGDPGGVNITNDTLSIDANGNVWVLAYPGQSGATGNGAGMLAGFSSLGAPLTPATTYNAATNTITYGGFGYAQVSRIYQPTLFQIDPSNNLWIFASPYFVELSNNEPSSAPSLVQEFSESFTSPTHFTFDSAGTLWANAATTLEKYNSTTETFSAYAPYSGLTAGTLEGIVFNLDAQNNPDLWLPYTKAAHSVALVNPSTDTVTAAYTTGDISGNQGRLVAAASGNVYDCNSADTGFLVYNSSSTTGAVNSFSPTGRCGNDLTVDGLSNIFAFNVNSTPLSIDAVSSTGTALSPVSTGYTGTSSAESPTLEYGAAAAIDGSGNLWVLNQTVNPTANPGSNALVEFVGLAAPVVTPASLALQDAQVGVRP